MMQRQRATFKNFEVSNPCRSKDFRATCHENPRK